MAIVHHPTRDLYVLLPPIATVGRLPGSDVPLVHARASNHHAEIVARPGGWDLRDKNSTNGTFVDGQPVRPGDTRTLRAGQQLVFGAPEETWQVVDTAEPQPCLFHPLTGDVRVADDDHRLSERVWYDLDQESWVVDGVPATDGQEVDGYLLRMPDADATVATQTVTVDLHHAHVAVVASRDYDRIDLRIDGPAQPIWFRDRAWALVLYVLACARVKQPDDGWMDVNELARACGLSRRVVDVYVLRARKFLAQAGIGGAASIVEVRTGMRRIGGSRISVEVAEP